MTKDVKKCVDFDNVKFGPGYSIIRQRGMWYVHTAEGVLMSETPWKDVMVVAHYVVAKAEDDSVSLIHIEDNTITSVIEKVDNIEYADGQYYFIVTNKGKKALYNGKQLIIAYDQFKAIEVDFDFSVVMMKYGEKRIVTDLEGNQLISQMCDEVIPWLDYYSGNRYLKVLVNGDWGLYRLGEGWIISCRMGHIEINSQYIECSYNGKKGIYDLNGKVMLNIRYLQIRKCGNVFKVAMKRGKKMLYGAYDLKGNVILPCEFSRVTINKESGTIEGEKIIRRVVKRIPN